MAQQPKEKHPTIAAAHSYLHLARRMGVHPHLKWPSEGRIAGAAPPQPVERPDALHGLQLAEGTEGRRRDRDRRTRRRLDFRPTSNKFFTTTTCRFPR